MGLNDQALNERIKRLETWMARVTRLAAIGLISAASLMIGRWTQPQTASAQLNLRDLSAAGSGWVSVGNFIVLLLLLGVTIAKANPHTKQAWAAAYDAQQFPPEAAGTIRYIACDGSLEMWQAVVLALNESPRTAHRRYIPARLLGFRLIRVDLAEMAQTTTDLVRLIETWEKLALDEPFFHVTGRELVEVPRFEQDGKWYTKRWLRVADYAPHVAIPGAMLVEATGSAAAIVDARHFLRVALTTTKGGLYYEFRGISPQRTLTEYLLDRGLDQSIVERLLSESRVLILKSGITGNQRIASMAQGSGNQPTDGPSVYSITHDPDDTDLERSIQPDQNLLDFRARAHETIVTKPGGGLEYGLFDGDGRLQNVAPPTVAEDTTIPDPHAKILQPAISCMVCHGSHNGWQPMRSVLPPLAERGFAAVLDVSRLDRELQFDTLNRISTLYRDQPDEPLRLAQNSYSDYVFRLTRVKVASAIDALKTTYQSYVYGAIDTQAALRELGYRVEQEQAVATFAQVVPRPPDGVIEDFIIAALREGESVRPEDFWGVYADLASRAIYQRDERN